MMIEAPYRGDVSEAAIPHRTACQSLAIAGVILTEKSTC